MDANADATPTSTPEALEPGCTRLPSRPPASVPWSHFARKLAPNPIRAISNEVAARISRGEDVMMLVGGRPPTEVVCPLSGLTFHGNQGSASIDLDPGDWNYSVGMSRGLPALQRWCSEHVAEHHSPAASAGHQTIVTVGSTHSICAVMLVLTNPHDPILCDEFAYSGLHAIAAPHDRIPVGVPSDGEGVVPAALERKCVELKARGTTPWLVYLTPTGNNPTAATMSEERRREIYQVCRVHGLFIVEDDPYSWLQLSAPRLQGEPAPTSEEMTGLRGRRTASFLPLDEDGRVIRLDSTSKVVSPAMRLGWLTAQAAVADKVALMAEVTTWPISCVSQGVFLALLNMWGQDGLHRHVCEVQLLYSLRRDLVHQAALRHLQGLAKWEPPLAGMFFWIHATGEHVTDAVDVIDDLLAHGVAVLPGACFVSSPEASDACPAFRISFTLIDSVEKADDAMSRIARVLRTLATGPPERGAVGRALAAPGPGRALQQKREEAEALRERLRILDAEIESMSTKK